jgi:DNA-binding NtrC family response regulator
MVDNRRTKVTQAALGPASVLTRLDTDAVRLVVQNTVSKGAAFELKGSDTAIIGAADDADLRIEDPTVSSEHAKVSRVDGGALVVDLGSTNGTFYEKSRVREVVVPFGAMLAVGKAQVKVVPQENAVRTPPSKTANFGALVGEDRRMREMFSLLADVAPTDATVVIEGETGTGKELVAKALHDHSPRAKQPFVVFDCSAVPHDLVESALFGHMKGSFTGATNTRQGAFRRAHHGTIFLDEIGELPLDLQPKLLRAIESRTVQMVGGDDYERVDVRVIAATNRNLKQEVRQGSFREDLYYRLAVVRIVLPPLRDRAADLEPLVRHFLQTAGQGDLELDPRGFEKMREYAWPGNVRELKNVVERGRSLFRGPGALDFGEYLPGGRFGGEHVGDEITRPRTLVNDDAPDVDPDVMSAVAAALTRDGERSFKDAKNLLVEAFERAYLTSLIGEHKGNISRAASSASMDRKHLRELLKKYGLWDND